MEVSRLGVRFINQISLTQPDSLNKLLALPPQSPSELPWPITSFMHQDIYNIPGYPYQMNVVQTVQPANSPANTVESFIIDLDVYTTSAVQLDELDGKLMDMHWIKNKAFISLLSSNAISRFKEQS